MIRDVVSTVGYVGPPPLTVGRVFTSWRAQPGALLTVALLGGGYAVGVGRLRPAGAGWPWRRTACFAVGVASLALVELSFLGVYDDVLFWTRATQNVVLLMITPMLLALGAPITLAIDVMPARWRGPLAGVLHSRTARRLTFPLVVTLVLVLPLPALYFSPLYELTLRQPAVSGLGGLLLVLAGFVYYWTRFRLDPTPRQDPYGITLVITIIEQVGDAVLGVVLWLGPLIAAGYYAALHRDWGPSLRTDQLLGAGILWIGGDLVGMPFIGVIFHRMVREDERRAAAIDHELDTAEPTEPAASRPATEPAPTSADPPGPAKLWWEDHPELSERFRRHRG